MNVFATWTVEVTPRRRSLRCSRLWPQSDTRFYGMLLFCLCKRRRNIPFLGQINRVHFKEASVPLKWSWSMDRLLLLLHHHPAWQHDKLKQGLTFAINDGLLIQQKNVNHVKFVTHKQWTWTRVHVHVCMYIHMACNTVCTLAIHQQEH